MHLLPKELMPWVLVFAPLFSKPVWESALVLLVGAIVAPGKRTVSAILRVMGIQHDPHFQNYHRVLSRALWSSRQASRLLLQQLVQVRRWVPHRAIILVADSSFVALEFLDALRQLPTTVSVITRLRLDAALYEPAPERQPKQIGRPRKVGKRLPTLQSLLGNPETVWQTLILEGWYGGRTCELQVASATAVWYHTGLPAVPIRWVLVKGPTGKLEPQAFLSTDIHATAGQILLWFRQRWQVEVTFEELRAHLGVETQRQWSDLAILRTTPALFALFSVVVLWAHQLQSQVEFSLPQSAWYNKSLPTFVDALALVRQRLWQARLFPFSRSTTNMVKIPRALLDCWFSLLCYAA